MAFSSSRPSGLLAVNGERDHHSKESDTTGADCKQRAQSAPVSNFVPSGGLHSLA